MKNTLATLILFFVAVFNCETLSAQENTLLWEVSREGIEEPSYLFGTFHMMCKDDFKMSEKMREAFSKTKQTVLEIDFSDTKQMMKMQQYFTSDQKISDQLNEEELERFTQGLQNFGYKLDDVDQFSPMVLYSMLSTKFFDCPQTDMKMLDMEIMKLTQAANKKIIGLETIEEQVDVFNNYLSTHELLKIVENYEEGKASTQTFLEFYKNESLNEIKKIFDNNEYMTKEQKTVMLEARNQKWVDKIPAIIEQNPTFFAVGAGHLIGESGLINLLKAQGFTVKPIFK